MISHRNIDRVFRAGRSRPTIALACGAILISPLTLIIVEMKMIPT
jgi:hypothetical protein